MENVGFSFVNFQRYRVLSNTPQLLKAKLRAEQRLVIRFDEWTYPEPEEFDCATRLERKLHKPYQYPGELPSRIAKWKEWSILRYEKHLPHFVTRGGEIIAYSRALRYGQKQTLGAI